MDLKKLTGHSLSLNDGTVVDLSRAELSSLKEMVGGGSEGLFYLHVYIPYHATATVETLADMIEVMVPDVGEGFQWKIQHYNLSCLNDLATTTTSILFVDELEAQTYSLTIADTARSAKFEDTSAGILLDPGDKLYIGIDAAGGHANFQLTLALKKVSV
jgi:hypothetical protein